MGQLVSKLWEEVLFLSTNLWEMVLSISTNKPEAALQSGEEMTETPCTTIQLQETHHDPEETVLRENMDPSEDGGVEPQDDPEKDILRENMDPSEDGGVEPQDDPEKDILRENMDPSEDGGVEPQDDPEKDILRENMDPSEDGGVEPQDDPEEDILRKHLHSYISETFEDFKRVEEFCETVETWITQRIKEQIRMKDIKSHADTFVGRFGKKDLEEELGVVLKDIQEGLRNLQPFLDAVEKLAVTSLPVFKQGRVQLEGVSSEAVRSLISTARLVSPLLIHFKRDAGAFFMPNLGNLAVLDFQLEKYICLTKQICSKIDNDKPKLGDLTVNHSWNFSFRMSGSKISMIDHLSKIRNDKSFRMSFLFKDNAQRFIDTFCECRPRMLQFLSDIEKSAVNLDKIKKSSSISTVAGSSVGAAGGVTSIVGLALAPFTAGASLGLTITGAVLAATSALNSVVTGITETKVSKTNRKNANNVFEKFMEDVQKILHCMDQAATVEDQLLDNDLIDTAFVAWKVLSPTGAIGKGIDIVVDGASAVKALRNVGLQEAKAARNIPNLAADLPDIGKLAKGTPLALSKAARVGFIGMNALFIGLDAFFICKESVSLAKRERSEMSQLLRSRASLWCTEIDAWYEIYDCLWKGKDSFTENLNVLYQPLNG